MGILAKMLYFYVKNTKYWEKSPKSCILSVWFSYSNQYSHQYQWNIWVRNSKNELADTLSIILSIKKESMSMQNYCYIQMCYKFSIIACSRYRSYVALVMCINTPCISSSTLISLRCRTQCNIPIDIDGPSNVKKWSWEINRLVIISGLLSKIA